MFRTLLSDQDPTVIFKFYNVLDDEYPSDINECDAYLITGSKHNSYDEALSSFANATDTHSSLVGCPILLAHKRSNHTAKHLKAFCADKNNKSR